MGNSGSIAKEMEEIIIKCPLEDMIKSFFKDYIIIWHDPNFYSQENQHYMSQLEKLCKVAAFLEWKEASQCIQYVTEAQAICHVITSGTNGEELVKEISSNETISNIYVFCQNKEYHSNWAKNYQKVSCVETQLQNILDQLQQNLMKWYKQVSSLKLNLPAFAPIFDDNDKSEMNHLHRYLKVIPNFRNRTQAKDDFLNLSKGIYSDPKNTKFIEEFEKDYNEYERAQTLKWYTRESFLYKVTNNCLRIASSDSIQYCRLLLKDIEQAIKEEYQTKSKHFYGLLYRGAYLSEDEWSSLKENTDREIEMHGFLSVSQEKSVAFKFLEKDPSKKVFITIIVPKGPNEEEQGFAEMEQYSQFPKEKEILFNVRSRFTVLETQNEYSPDLPCRHLVLLYGAQGFRRFLAEKTPVQNVEILEIEDISCARCQVKAGEIAEKMFFMSLQGQYYCCQGCVDKINIYDPAPLLCISLLENAGKMHTRKIKGCLLMNSGEIETPFYGYECLNWSCQGQKQKKYFLCLDCGEKKKRWCENCFENSLTCVQSEHNILLERRPYSFWCERMSDSELSHLDYQKYSLGNNNVFQQADMYFKNHKYEKAIQFYLIYIQQNEGKWDIRKLAESYNNIGLAYSLQAEYNKAIEYHLKSLNISQSVFREQSATSYNNIGYEYERLGEDSKALEYYMKSLEIRKSVHEESHPVVADSYNNLGMHFLKQKKYDEALEYLLKALNIYKSLQIEYHPNVAKFYSNIGSVYKSQREYDKALEYSLKSLDIGKSLHGEQHPDIAVIFYEIGIIYEKLGQLIEALDYHFKSLEISRRIRGENHSEVAASYDRLGGIFDKEREFDMALDNYFLSLEIYISLNGELHPHVADSIRKIARMYEKLEELEEAIMYYLRYLHICRSVYGENHLHVVNSYDSLGVLYQKQGEFETALEYYFKSLDIEKSLHGEQHIDVAKSYHRIGSIYQNLREFKEAEEFHQKSLDIFKSLYGENHPDVALSFESIARVFSEQGESTKALEVSLKALDVYKSVFGESHANVARSYNNIGYLYHIQGEGRKSLEYHLKAFEIGKSVHGKEHPDVATSCSNIAVMYYYQGQENKAREYYMESLEITKLIYGENHQQTEILQSYFHKLFNQDREENQS